MAGSFGKRENEKKKQSKRLEKQKRKEQRKAEGTSSPDEMIAYVDKNGNITDTPPELVKEEIKLEDVAISIPKKEDMEPEIQKGRVEHLNSDRGYGFIKDLASTEKYFFHVSSAPAGITEGNIVFFELERGTRGMNAVRIEFAN